MLEIIGIILLIYWVSTEWGTQTAAIVFLVIAGILLVMFCKAWADGDRAYLNWIGYWKKGGPKHDDAAHTYTEHTEQRITHARLQVVQKPHNIESVQRMNDEVPTKEQLFVCPTCGRYIRTSGQRIMANGESFTVYYCPNCRAMRTTSI